MKYHGGEASQPHRNLAIHGDRQLNLRKYSIDFALTFAVVLFVSIIVAFLYSLIAHGQVSVD